jgi:hypothetical protein
MLPAPPSYLLVILVQEAGERGALKLYLHSILSRTVLDGRESTQICEENAREQLLEIRAL